MSSVQVLECVLIPRLIIWGVEVSGQLVASVSFLSHHWGVFCPPFPPSSSHRGALLCSYKAL